MRLALLVLATALVGCDALTKSCTEIGCLSALTVTVTADGGAVPEFHGTITVGDVDVVVACNGTDATGSAEGVTCLDGGVVILPVTEASGGGEVSWLLTGSDPADTGWGYSGGGTVTPEWSASEPNGPDCPPTCYTGDLALSLDVLD